MEKYLYAASVQGIQSFIFQTNVLQDIVGASELVDFICTRAFKDLLGAGWKKKSQVIAAAGNVKYIFDTREECEKAVAEFPRRVMTMAPGITISQAVVKYDDKPKENFEAAINKVEERLRAQRNRIQPPVASGLLGIRRAPGTGLPAVGLGVVSGDRVFIDASTKSKQAKNNLVSLCVKSFYGKYKEDAQHAPLYERVPFDVSEMCRQNDWIAVIHADGNSLGQVVRNVGHDQENFRLFSRLLDSSTAQSANEAFRSLKIDTGKNFIPIRPIVLGGDDMTVIIRGDLAMPYVREYMRCFEKHTGEGDMAKILAKAKMSKLTVCAGVAFIKSSFPFYYGYRLAESLCEAAKKQAKAINKNNAPSCLMFHKVQDSFIESYADIAKRELTVPDGRSFQYGPYYLNASGKPQNYSTIEDLLALSKDLGSDDEEGDDIRPAIRRWLGLLHESGEKADQWRSRVLAVHTGSKELIAKLTGFIEHGSTKACPAYDALALNTISRQVTREAHHDD
ncbi:MAG: hypothetical protein SPL25_06525 [Succinivibrionaceae bacterium]|nr:hypothetical protein [Succinivibrionaceae bacterium]